MSCELGDACSFSNLSITSPKSQIILQSFCRFTYVTAHSPTLLSLLLRHRNFSYVSFYLCYSSAHSPTFPSLHLRLSSFSNPSVALPTSQLILSNPSVALPTSQLILQPFFHIVYVTGSSLTSPGELPMYCNIGEIGLY